MKLSDVKPGMTLVVDGRFVCLPLGQHVIVEGSYDDRLFVPCVWGRHYLGRQVDREDLVGFTLASDPDPISGAL